MGIASSQEDEVWEHPSEKHQATLYYFGGRGLADQLRWMMAATNVTFTQKVINQRGQFERMARRQLPFGQLPLLQIDDLEIVQSQAAVRYLARRANIQGRTPEEVLKCDMIAETVKDLLSLVTGAAFKRSAAQVAKAAQQSDSAQPSTASSEATCDSNGVCTLKDPAVAIAEWEKLQQTMKEKWAFTAARFEAVLASNNRNDRRISQPSPTSPQASAHNNHSHSNSLHPDIVAYNNKPDMLFLVGRSLTYADVLVAHLATWFIEECGVEIVVSMPLLVQLQNQVISLPGIRQFIQSKLYFPLGGPEYCDQVRRVLNRNI